MLSTFSPVKDKEPDERLGIAMLGIVEQRPGTLLRNRTSVDYPLIEALPPNLSESAEGGPKGFL